MGSCLAQAAIELGHQVTVVSGPVSIQYPTQAKVVSVISTEEMLKAAAETFKDFDGCIAVAAPCDYRPEKVATQKIKKSGDKIELSFVETPDIVGSLGKQKQNNQWSVCFALETEDGLNRAVRKLKKKNCDLVVLNGAAAMNSSDNEVQIIDPDGKVIRESKGPKPKVAQQIMAVIQERLISKD